MKKRVSFILMMTMFLLCVMPGLAEAAEADAGRFEAFYYAMNMERIMDHHSSVLIESQIYCGDELIGTQYRYADATHLCMLSSDGIAYLNTFGFSVMAGDTLPGSYCT